MSETNRTETAVEDKVYYDAYWAGTAGWKPADSIDGTDDIDLGRWISVVANPETRVLDIGCGDGSHYAEFLMRQGVELHGVDISEVAVEKAKTRGVRAQCAHLDVALPFPSDHFDNALCLEVMEHLLDPEFAASEILRVLRPGGRLLMSVPNVGHWRSRAELALLGHFNPKGSPVTAKRYPWRDPHIRFFNHAALSNMLTDVGFQVEKKGGLDPQFLNAAPGLRRVIRWPLLRPLERLTRQMGRSFYRLLAGRCVVVACKPAP